MGTDLNTLWAWAELWRRRAHVAALLNDLLCANYRDEMTQFIFDVAGRCNGIGDFVA